MNADIDNDGAPDSVLALAAITGVAQCGLDLSTKALDNVQEQLESSLAGAVSATGLNQLSATLVESARAFQSNLPKIEVPFDFATEFDKLNLKSPVDIQAFQERWGNIVTDLSELLKLPNIDLCSLASRNIKAVTDSAGNIVQKVIPKSPLNPSTIPIPSPKALPAVFAQDTSAGALETTLDITPLQGFAGKDLWVAAKALLRTDICKTETAEASKGLIRLTAQKDYQTMRQSRSEKTPSVLTKERIDELTRKESLYRGILYAAQQEKLMVNLACMDMSYYIRSKSKVLLVEKFPTWDKDILKMSVRLKRLGAKIDGTETVYTLELYNQDVLRIDLINKSIEQNVWKEEPVRGLAKYFISTQTEGVIV